MGMSSSNRKKHTAFAVLCLACGGLIGAYVYSAKNSPTHSRDHVSVTPALPPPLTERKNADKVMERKAPPSEDDLPGRPVQRETDREPPAAKSRTPAEKTVPAKTLRIFFRHNGSDSEYGRLAF